MPAVGPQGYPDYQRVDNRAGPSIVIASNEKRMAAFQSEVLDVQRYEFIEGVMQAGVQKVKVVLEWFSDAEGEHAITRQAFFLDNLAGAQLPFSVRNLGPWVTVKAIPEKGVSEWELSCAIFPSNRQVQANVVSLFPVALASGLIKVGAKATKVLLPQALCAGPAELVVNTTFFNMTVIVSAMSTGFAYQSLGFYRTSTGIITSKIILPMTTWRIEILNETAAEGEGVASIVASATGSS